MAAVIVTPSHLAPSGFLVTAPGLATTNSSKVLAHGYSVTSSLRSLSAAASVAAMFAVTMTKAGSHFLVASELSAVFPTFEVILIPPHVGEVASSVGALAIVELPGRVPKYLPALRLAAAWLSS